MPSQQARILFGGDIRIQRRPPRCVRAFLGPCDIRCRVKRQLAQQGGQGLRALRVRRELDRSG